MKLQPSKKIKKTLAKTNKLVPSKAETPDELPKDSAVPRITNETVASHREEVLKGARKYIYPLQHSKNKIIIITTSIILIALIAFFTYTTLALYKFASYSPFLYRVTQVIPFPIARVNGHFVSYNNYLFELEHYIHYYQTQQKLNFNTTSGEQQLANYKQRALQKVLDDAYINELAAKNRVTVSSQQINDQIAIVRQQNKLGSNEAEFENVLKNYYGWSLSDFKRELKTQLLAQNLVSKLDTGTHQRAQSALNQLNSGTDFATLAKQVSDDATSKANGGQYGSLINADNVNIPPQVTAALFALKPGQISGIINTGYSLEIVKNNGVQGNQIQASHIVFNFQDLNNYLNPIKDKQKAKTYVTLN